MFEAADDLDTEEAADRPYPTKLKVLLEDIQKHKTNEKRFVSSCMQLMVILTTFQRGFQLLETYSRYRREALRGQQRQIPARGRLLAICRQEGRPFGVSK